MNVKDIEVLGRDWALKAMRMPYLSEGTEEKDILLSKKLVMSGREHRKFLRQIIIQAEIEASMSFWFEFDTYKVGVTSNSESFWNTFSGKLEVDKFVRPEKPNTEYYVCLESITKTINAYIEKENPPKEVLRYLVPQGIKYNRIVTMTGEAFLNMIIQRQNHRLHEWIVFLAESLLQMSELDARLFAEKIDPNSLLNKELVKYGISIR